MNWPTQSLSSLGTIQTGSTPSTSKEKFWGGEIPFVTPSELDQSIPVTITPRTLSEEGGREARLLQEGAVLVCCIGSLGKIGIAGRTLATNQQINSVEFDPLHIWPRFGYYACRTLKSKLLTMAPATTVPIANKSKFEQLEIPVPPLPEQRRIAAILDQADALRAKRREALAQLDSLTQSIFIEMFGDPSSNPKGWVVNPVDNFILSVTNGMTRRRIESDKGTDIVLRLRDIRSGWIDFSDVNRITLKPNESEKYGVSTGDILFIRVNGNPDYVGRCAVFEDYSEPVFFNDHIMRVKVDQSKIHCVFLAFLLNGAHGKEEITKHRKTSAGQHTINQGGLGKIQVPTPPIKLQAEFVCCLESLGKQKNTLKASQAELDALFASLQYRAFRGEL